MTRCHRGHISALAALLLCSVFAVTSQADARSPALKVCLEEESPPFSYKFGKRAGGLDLAVAASVAERLDRPLIVQWFESENDEENVHAWEANALLTNGLCDLIGGYPMIASALRNPPQDLGRLPEYDGQAPRDRWKTVPLGLVAPTRPYYRTGFAAITGPGFGRRVVTTLDSLAGHRIVAEVSTLASTILVIHRGGRLVKDVSHVAPGTALGSLETGEYDATVIELHRFDWYRHRKPDSELRWSGYLHPVGVNLGFLARANDVDLIGSINRILGVMIADGALVALATGSNMTYLLPKKPYVVKEISLRQLRDD